MGKFNDVVKNALKSDIGNKGDQCTTYVEKLIYRAYKKWLNCKVDGYPIEFINDEASRKGIEEFFEVHEGVNSWKSMQPFDIPIWSKYNVYSHSAVFLGFEGDLLKCLTSNYRGSQHGGSNEDKPLEVSIQNHHTWGFAGFLRPIENTLPVICLDSVVAQNSDITVSGWAFDKKNLTDPLAVHVYTNTEPKYLLGELLTTVPRDDVNNAYGITGIHGFHGLIETSLVGDYGIVVAAIDSVDPWNHTWSKQKEVKLKAKYIPKVGDKVICTKGWKTPDSNDLSIGYGNGIEVYITSIIKDERAIHKYEICALNGLPRFTEEDFIYEIK